MIPKFSFNFYIIVNARVLKELFLIYCVHLKMYRGVTLALQEAAQDPSTHITALTGTGDYYSSGNDLSSMTAMTVGEEEGIMAEIKKAATLIKYAFYRFGNSQ